MKKLIIFLSLASAILSFGVNVAQAGIDDVEINPLIPNQFDSIEIITNGVESSSISLGETIFTKNGADLQLDIHIDVGFLTVITPWSHTETIGTLSPGIYNLTVNSIRDLEPQFNDTFETSFEVVPEPTSLLLLALAGAKLCSKQPFNERVG